MENMLENSRYDSDELAYKYRTERNTWGQFYESERRIIQNVFDEFPAGGTILDVGCGCGGLAKALQERGYVFSYRGIDIARNEIEIAQNRDDLLVKHEFICEDICKYSNQDIYDAVFSLSCIDWNNDVDGMLEQCWKRVVPGGYLIATFRITNHKTIKSGAYQFIDSKDHNKRANYVVFNYNDLLHLFYNLKERPDYISMYGYWGLPSPTAVVSYDKICFVALCLRKPKRISGDYETVVNQELPISLFI